MADFLTRLAERTLEVVPVAQPITTSMFAKRRTVSSTPSAAEGFPVQDEVQATLEPVRRPGSSRTTPQSPRALPRANPSYQIAATPVQPLLQTPEGLATPQPQELPQFSEHVEAELPPTNVKGSTLPGANADSREEQPDAVSRRDTSPKEDPRANISHVGKPLKHVQEAQAPMEPVAWPDQQAGKVGAMVQGIREVNSHAIAPQGGVTREQHADTPLAGGQLTQRQESLASPIKAPAEHAVLHDTSSGPGVEIVQRERPGGISRKDAVSGHLEIQSNPNRLPGSDSMQQQSTPTQKRDNLMPEQQPLLVPAVQQQEVSVRQQAEPLFTDECSSNPGAHRRQLPTSLPQNQQVTTSQRTAASTTEAASATPTIRVTIGRIDVRAVTPPAPAPRPKPIRAGPTLSLDDYTRQRKGGGR